jgi:cohesin loading factor subunit SCC2
MLLKRISEARDSDDPGYFVSISTDEGELSGLTDTALAMLGDAVSKVNNLGCFPEVSAEDILMLQSLCEPLVTAASRLPFDLESDSDDDQLRLLTQTELGLKGCRMIMQTMTEGRDERRICSEDLIQGIVRLLKRLFASVIAPVVESRRSGSSSQLFVIGSKHKKELHGILRRCATIISQIATLIGKVKLTEYTLSGIESLAVDIIFSQNSAHETDSALGIQKFETFRQTAMDVIAQIFSFHPDQRNSLAVEILTNLEKLPDKRASARNFRSAHESPIMLASALFMRMVQASTNNDRSDEASAPSLAESEEEDAEGDSDFEALESQGRARKSRHQRRTPREMASQAVASVRKVATLIIQTMVAKAENVSKSGDKPFRNLLDLFVGDLCSVLGSPEWPAASLFLEMLLAIMQRQKDKSVQAADMALATMGTMGVGMIDFATRLKAVKRDLDITHSSLSSKLVPLVDDSLKHSIHLKDVLSLDGPYRAVLDSLSRYLNPHSPRVAREDPHFRSLSSYYAAYWAYSFYKVFGEEEQKGVAPHPSVDALEKHIRQLIGDPDWISKD